MFILQFQDIQEFGMIQVEACISISEPHAERKIIPEEPGQSRGDIDQGFPSPRSMAQRPVALSMAHTKTSRTFRCISKKFDGKNKGLFQSIKE